MDSYLDDNQLVNSGIGYKNEFNAILYSVEYALASGDIEYANYLRSFVETKLKLREGLYTSFPGCLEVISHDNLTAIMAISSPEIRKTIWKQLIFHCFRYDDIHPDSPEWSRLMHPRDIIFYGQLAGSWICWLLLPILFIIFFIECLDTGEDSAIDTSGQMLLYVRCKALQSNFIYKLLFKLFTWKISFNRLSTWKEVALYYFRKDSEHPVVKAINP